MKSTGKTALYRVFDVEDHLLYVGVSSSALRRTAEHARSKAWWDRVARIEVEWCETRLLAEQAERQAILDEEPLHNIACKPRIRVKRPRGGHDLTWRCDECGGPIDNDGFIQLDTDGYWWACCRACDTLGYLTDYYIEIDEIRTYSQHSEWLAHLRTKRWFDEAEWGILIRRACKEIQR